MILTEIFLQIGVTPDQIAESGVSADDSVSILDLILKGGWMMIPIFALSIAAIYIIVERILTLKKADKDPYAFMEKIRDLVVMGEIQNAQLQCQQFNTPFSRMIEKGISKLGTPLANIEASIENTGKIEVYRLEKNLSALATIAGAAPMLGFLGTVTGMIQAFIAIAQEEGSISPKLLSSGIYEAMVTTVAGLIVGVIAYIGYNYLVGKVQKIIHKMEYSSIE
ncbi:MAG TPA: MotA/TolQ/ExbB proton channel family protein, partial [Cytophagaceae bacterium]